jgi:hypothetical protein
MDGDDVEYVLDWPGSVGENSDRIKVPSKLRFDKDKEPTAWGYDKTDNDSYTASWFKLALPPDSELPPNVLNSQKLQETRETLKDLGMDATKAMAHYIEGITTHTFRAIKESIGRRAYQSTPFHVVITVPAIWKPHTIEKMKTAASVSILQSRSPGLTTYEFVSEPEAAVQAYAPKLQRKLREGEVVLVLDLGGGTGDAISYQKTAEDGEGSGMALVEEVPGDGMRSI